jgi:hypothetical protein
VGKVLAVTVLAFAATACGSSKQENGRIPAWKWSGGLYAVDPGGSATDTGMRIMRRDGTDVRSDLGDERRRNGAPPDHGVGRWSIASWAPAS